MTLNGGNLFAMTAGGGSENEGLLFVLLPVNGGWVEVNLHSFSEAGGAIPSGGVTVDNRGNLFGTTEYGGGSQLGVVWQQAP